MAFESIPIVGCYIDTDCPREKICIYGYCGM